MKSRNDSVDTMRGLACLLLVFSHSIGGMNLPNDLSIVEVNSTLQYLRMPMFTFLSGLVYSYRPLDIKHSSVFIQGKIRRLLIPFLFVGTVYTSIRMLAKEGRLDFLNLLYSYFYETSYLWFIQAVFLIFCLIVFLERIRAFNNICSYSIVFIFSFMFNIFNPQIDFLSLNGFFYLLPYFLFGMGVNRYMFADKVYKLRLLFVFIPILILSLSFTGIIELGSPRTSPIAIFLGCIFCLGLYTLRIQSQCLSRVGVYSYTIYLFHGFFTSGSRPIFHLFEIESIYVMVLFSTLLGVFVPILMHHALSKNSMSKLLFLGQKQKRVNYSV